MGTKNVHLQHLAASLLNLSCVWSLQLSPPAHRNRITERSILVQCEWSGHVKRVTLLPLLKREQ